MEIWQSNPAEKIQINSLLQLKMEFECQIKQLKILYRVVTQKREPNVSVTIELPMINCNPRLRKIDIL